MAKQSNAGKKTNPLVQTPPGHKQPRKLPLPPRPPRPVERGNS